MNNRVDSEFGMYKIEQSFEVRYHYPVHFVDGLLKPNQSLLAETFRSENSGERPKVMVVMDQGVVDAHPTLLDDFLAYHKIWADDFSLAGNPVVVPGGEQVKRDSTWVTHLIEQMDREKVDRHSYVCAIGGGAVIDMAGYAASITHRGIRIVRIPTTVLAQNDAAVGVKNGVNAYGKKNFLGTFAIPHAVINDASFLSTLDDRDWRSGIAEAVKVALIRDGEFFRELEELAPLLAQRDTEAMQRLIIRCAELHLRHIATSGDPFETGSARPLDFGHWSAHKLEQLSSFHIRHGEAVASGIALDVIYSRMIGRIDRSLEERVLHLFRNCGFELWYNEMAPTGDSWPLFEGISEFREHLGGALTLTLLDAEGTGVEVHSVDESVYREATAFLKTWVNDHVPA
ncbi:MAG: 3-dehydroquinate synthase [Balneolaceae bacterium]